MIRQDLHERRNYYLSMPILCGLVISGHVPLNVHPFRSLVDETNNFENYRALWEKRPGYPFLFPHLQQLSESSNPGAILHDIYNIYRFLRIDEPESSLDMDEDIDEPQQAHTRQMKFSQCWIRILPSRMIHSLGRKS